MTQRIPQIQTIAGSSSSHPLEGGNQDGGGASYASLVER